MNRCAVSPTDRLNKAVLVTKLIEECALDKKQQCTEFLERLEEEQLTPDIENFQENISIETFTILSTATLIPTALCMFSILDGAMKEVVCFLSKCFFLMIITFY